MFEIFVVVFIMSMLIWECNLLNVWINFVCCVGDNLVIDCVFDVVGVILILWGLVISILFRVYLLDNMWDRFFFIFNFNIMLMLVRLRLVFNIIICLFCFVIVIVVFRVMLVFFMLFLLLVMVIILINWDWFIFFKLFVWFLIILFVLNLLLYFY